MQISAVCRLPERQTHSIVVLRLWLPIAIKNGMGKFDFDNMRILRCDRIPRWCSSLPLLRHLLLYLLLRLLQRHRQWWRLQLQLVAAEG
jgi:hypothetical protein